MALLIALICSRDIEAPNPSEREQFILTCETEIMAKGEGEYEPVHQYSCEELWDMTYGK